MHHQPLLRGCSLFCFFPFSFFSRKQKNFFSGKKKSDKQKKLTSFQVFGVEISCFFLWLFIFFFYTESWCQTLILFFCTYMVDAWSCWSTTQIQQKFFSFFFSFLLEIVFSWRAYCSKRRRLNKNREKSSKTSFILLFWCCWFFGYKLSKGGTSNSWNFYTKFLLVFNLNKMK